MIDPVVSILYNGEPLLEVSLDGKHVVHSTTVGHMRVNGALFDIDTGRMRSLSDRIKAGEVNPYRDAVIDSQEQVYAAIEQRDRRGMNRKDVKTVLDAVAKVASRSVQ
jgi:hypothetical protein